MCYIIIERRVRGLFEEENTLKKELEKIKESINNFEEVNLKSEEMNGLIAKIQKENDYINKDARPKFIRFCKEYIDMRKIHASELRITGQIKHNKINERIKRNRYC